MFKLYLLGGEYLKKRDSKEINQKAFTDAGKDPLILVFPWTREKENKEYRKVMNKYFKDLGAGEVKYVELTDSLKIIKEKMESSDLIYLPGGDSKLLIKRLKKVDSLIKNYNKVIIGNSAGAHALCKKFIGMKGRDGREENEILPGMDLIDFAIVVHYEDKHAKDLVKISDKLNMPIYAIPEQCALVYENKKIELIGKVKLFKKG